MKDKPVMQLLSTVFWQEELVEPEGITAVYSPVIMLCCLVLVQSSHIQTVLSQSAETHHTERLLPIEKEKKNHILIFIALFKYSMSTIFNIYKQSVKFPEILLLISFDRRWLNYYSGVLWDEFGRGEMESMG
jgi:uncharacterized protein YsxB (DUF464 family)